MIKAGDLRFGNVMTHLMIDALTERTLTFMKLVKGEDIDWCAKNPDEFNRCHRAIPLTPEWLERAGFAWTDASRSHMGLELPEDNEIFFYFKDGEINLTQLYSKGCMEGANFPPTNYLHQLQNLYHALTGNELKIKEPQPA